MIKKIKNHLLKLFKFYLLTTVVCETFAGKNAKNLGCYQNVILGRTFSLIPFRISSKFCPS